MFRREAKKAAHEQRLHKTMHDQITKVVTDWTERGYVLEFFRDHFDRDADTRPVASVDWCQRVLDGSAEAFELSDDVMSGATDYPAGLAALRPPLDREWLLGFYVGSKLSIGRDIWRRDALRPPHPLFTPEFVRGVESHEYEAFSEIETNLGLREHELAASRAVIVSFLAWVWTRKFALMRESPSQLVLPKHSISVAVIAAAAVSQLDDTVAAVFQQSMSTFDERVDAEARQGKGYGRVVL